MSTRTVTAEIPEALARQLERITRDGWFADEQAIIVEALEQLVEGKTFLGDSPRMLHRFAADALNESKPDTALKFVDRGLSLLDNAKISDLNLFHKLIELRVQILLIVGRDHDALLSLEAAQERLPNNPTISRWIERVRARGA
jgi:hypothetical protein